MRKTKSVSFDLGDAFERRLLERAQTEKFSRYVKRLIAADLGSPGKVPSAPSVEAAPAPAIKTPEPNRDALATFL